MEVLFRSSEVILGALVYVGLVAVAGAGFGILLRTIFRRDSDESTSSQRSD